MRIDILMKGAPTMLQKIFSTFFYILAGFFLYLASIFAFIKFDPEIFYRKIVVFIIFLAFWIILLSLGLFMDSFKNWQRDTGIVILSSAGFTLFAILMIACVLLSPALVPYLKMQNVHISVDYVYGVTSMIIFTMVGLYLIKSKK